MLAAVGHDLLNLTVTLDGISIWPPGTVSFLEGGVWRGKTDLIPHGPSSIKKGEDLLGSFKRHATVYTLGAALIELSVRSYSKGDILVFEQSFPRGINATLGRFAPAPHSVGTAPLSSWPSFSLAGPSESHAWRSWHGTYGSFSGVGLSSNDSLVFNGVPTMPLLFFRSTSHELQSSIRSASPRAASPARSSVGGAAVLVSPLNEFKSHAHAAVALDSSTHTSWQHGPSHLFDGLPANYSISTILVAAKGQTATVQKWGMALRTWHRTERAEALAADVAVHRIGYWTDNGAYYNFNKWAGNLMAGREWSPRKDPSRSPDALLTATLASLRASGVLVGYIQLDDWWYDGVVYEGAVSCVREWQARPDWFPSGLASFAARAGAPLLLYVPYLCNDTSFAQQYELSYESASHTKHGGVADAPPPATSCAWPQEQTCEGVYAQPAPRVSERFYSSLFERGKREAMVSFEHDFVGSNSVNFGWDQSLGAGSAWLQGMGRAAASRRVPIQLCLATASDLLESLTMNWVTNARASADYAFCSDSWDIGFSSMLHWAVDVRPFKDVMWTTAHQPGSPYENTTLFPSMYTKCIGPDGIHRQPNVALDALISAFSTGPVGLGDGLGMTNTVLALATSRADGVLLHPSKPLTPLDRTWWPSGRAANGWVLGSYTEISGSLVWQYVVTVDTACGASAYVHPQADLFWPKLTSGYPEDERTGRSASRYAVFRRGHDVGGWGQSCVHGERAYGSNSCVELVGDDTPNPRFEACTEPDRAFSNGTHSWSITTLSPMLPGAGWALLGEPNKFVSVSNRRFASIDGSHRSWLLMELYGVPGEKVELLVVSPHPDATLFDLHVTLPLSKSMCNVSVSGFAKCA